MDPDPLLHPTAALSGVVDYRGRPVSSSESGGWTAALFIIGVEVAERFAYYGVSLNLITYLTESLGDSTASAAAALNAWSGVASMLPLLGAFIADSYLGRFRMIVAASLLYVLLRAGWEMDPDPLLRPTALSGVVHYRGRPVSTPESGGWTSALFIIGVEVAERFAYAGVSLNLITYLTGPLGESTASAAAALNVWDGVASMMPLLGAFIADSYLGRYRTIVCASLLYVLGLGMLTLSSALPALRPPKCNDTVDPTACLPTQFQVAFFYVSLYFMAFAQGGHKPCVQAFGADQFDENDPKELVSRSSFFNWWYFSMCGGIVVANLILSYVQENISWGIGFGIPCITMVIALVVFLMGTKTYRYYHSDDKSPFTKIGKALITLARRKYSIAEHPATSEEAGDWFLNAETVQVDDAKGVLRLFPIWATCLIYAVVFAQSPTFFTKQGRTMDRRIGSNFQIPPAALQSVITGTIVIFIPIYDRLLVPIAKRFSSTPSGITTLQRIGTGMFLSVLATVIAALVEIKRLKTARDFGLVDLPTAVIPMSLWWLVPQYALYGVSEAFTMVGLQEFFYDQMPDALRSLGLALYLSIFGVGSFISSIIISVIDRITSRTGESWFSNNLNRGHLDYFYWILAVLSGVQLVCYVYFARYYVYKSKGITAA